MAQIGLGELGVWSIIQLINPFVSFFDLGLQSAGIKLVADAYAQKDSTKINYIFTISITLYVIIFLFGLSASVFGDGIIAGLLLGKDFIDKYRAIVRYYLIITFAGLLIIPFDNILRGFQRYERSNFLEVVASIANAVVTIVGLINGYGLISLVIGSAAALIWRVAAFVFAVHRVHPQIRIEKSAVMDLKLYKSLFFLSPADLSVRIYLLATQSIMRYSLVAFGGFPSLGAYEVARRVVTQINGMSATIFAPLLPVISTLNVFKKGQDLSNVVRKSLSYLGMVSTPIVIFVFVFCAPLMRAWLDIADVSYVTLATRMLLVGSAIDLFTGPLTVASVGMGTAKIVFLKLVSPLILYMVLPLSLGSVLGFSGVLLGEAVALSVGAIVGIRLFEKWAGISALGAAMYSIRRSALLTMPVALIIWLLWHLSTDWTGWVRLTIWGGIFLLYLIVVSFFYRIMGLISRQEINSVRLAFGLSGRDC